MDDDVTKDTKDYIKMQIDADDDLFIDIPEETPEETPEIPDNIENNIKNVDNNMILCDINKTSFNIKIHAVNHDGTPITNRDGTFRRRAGRPKGSRTDLKLDKSSIIDAFEGVNVNAIMRSNMKRNDKLKLFTAIALDPKTNNSDRIRAIDAHTRLTGETEEGLQRYAIAVFVIPPNITDKKQYNTFLRKLEIEEYDQNRLRKYSRKPNKNNEEDEEDEEDEDNISDSDLQ